ncbi:MAG: amidohydrolase family protein [Phycisphaerae bacterium]|nr:amidohydrolase family protein [Tepidisphaeraceae bacterium]
MSRRTTEISRRAFLATSVAAVGGCATSQHTVVHEPPDPPGPLFILDLHQHTNYLGRTDEQLIAHQRNMGVAYTILLPAGSPAERPVTHMGKSNGLAAKCFGNESCLRLMVDYPESFGFFANETPDLESATTVLEEYLERGALGIGEQKFNVDVESPAMARVYDVAKAYGVPVLMHFQHGTYNHGYDRFWRVLRRWPTVNFIAHAQTTWVNVSANPDQTVLYPKTRVTPGGITDRYLRDYANFYADVSAGSGLGALLRDEEHARGFLKVHQDKVLFGTDCADVPGKAPVCQGANTITAIKRLGISAEIREKMFYESAAKLIGGGCGVGRAAVVERERARRKAGSPGGTQD